jgi:Sulfite exporter TauE/SafE.
LIWEIFTQKIFFYLLFFAIAFTYSMVGLGGGTAYTAILTITNTPYKIIPSTALFLNMVVSIISFLNYRAYFPSERKSLILLVYLFGGGGTILGANLNIKEKTFFIILGIALILSAIISFLNDFGSKKINFKIKKKYITSYKLSDWHSCRYNWNWRRYIPFTTANFLRLSHKRNSINNIAFRFSKFIPWIFNEIFQRGV